jgi:hypothetical protein
MIWLFLIFLIFCDHEYDCSSLSVYISWFRRSVHITCLEVNANTTLSIDTLSNLAKAVYVSQPHTHNSHISKPIKKRFRNLYLVFSTTQPQVSPSSPYPHPPAQISNRNPNHADNHVHPLGLVLVTPHTVAVIVPVRAAGGVHATPTGALGG